MSSVKADFNWLSEDAEELAEKYPDKWIAVHAGTVIGVGETAVQADDQARTQCPDGTTSSRPSMPPRM